MTTFDTQTTQAAIRWPFALPAHPAKRAAKMALGRLLLALLPARGARVLAHGDPMHFGALDRLLLAGQLAHAQARNDYTPLAGVQQRFWAGQGGAIFNTVADVADRFESWFLGRHGAVIEALAREIGSGGNWQAFTELGSGNGLALDYMNRRFPGIGRWTGVDLNDTATQANRARWPGGRLHFATGEAAAWVRENAAPQGVWFSNAGVLEYLPESRLARMLQGIAQNGAPAVFALIEPLAHGHDLARETRSQVKPGEFTFSHNHRHLFSQAGWTIKYCEELHHETTRWLLLVARV